MKLKHIVILVAVFVMAIGTAAAQVVDTSFYKAARGHYVALEVGYGLMNVQHKMTSSVNSTDPKYGVQARFSYRWYILKHWALGTGLHYQQMGTKSTMNHTQSIVGAVDELGRPIEHRTLFHGVEEDMSAQIFSIPAGMHFHGGQVMKRMKFNAGGGVMFNFSMTNSFKTKGELETRLYYDNYHLELSDIRGHNVYTKGGFSGKYDLIPSISVFAEAGLVYSLNRRIDLTLTALGAYGINPVVNSGKYVYDPDCMASDGYKDVKYNGVLGSEEASGVRLVNIGGMFGIRYRIGTYNLNPDELERERRHRGFNEAEFERNRLQEFERLERQRREDSARVAIEEEARKQREFKEAEFIRQQRVRDSIAKVTADSLAALDSARMAQNDTTHMSAVMTEVVRVELDSIIRSLNENHCKFNDANAVLTHQQKKDLDRLAYLMTLFPSIEISCTGHTCDIGSDERNQTLGMKRAKAFANELIKRGVSPDRIECFSKGAKEPLAPNTSEKNREKNRRIEIKRK